MKIIETEGYFRFLRTQLTPRISDSKLKNIWHFILNRDLDKIGQELGVKIEKFNEYLIDVPELYAQSISWRPKNPSCLFNTYGGDILIKLDLNLKSYSKEEIPSLCHSLEDAFNNFEYRANLIRGIYTRQSMKINYAIFYDFFNRIQELQISMVEEDSFLIQVENRQLVWYASDPSKLYDKHEMFQTRPIIDLNKMDFLL